MAENVGGGAMSESLWESLVLSYFELAGPPDVNGSGIAFRDVKFQDTNNNTFFVQVFWGLQRGKQIPQGFEPVTLGLLVLHLVRTNANELKPHWVTPGPQSDYHTAVLFNRSAFPVFLA